VTISPSHILNKVAEEIDEASLRLQRAQNVAPERGDQRVARYGAPLADS